ncbi:MAG: response regulator [Bacteroidetes bacterium]|nr:response regulator [Bacteroidota bacterium]
MKTILVIEDNSDILENTTEILELANFKVLNAKNGKEGIDEAMKSKPDVILCDIMMPEASGYEVLLGLKKNPITKNIPFIFVTATVEKKDVNNAMDMGADGYLKKPFEIEDLLKIVRSFIKD